MIYNKICKDPRCKKHFQSESRNQAFCSSECQKRYFMERKKRRVKYKKQMVENQIASAAYRVSELVADKFMPEKVCRCCGGEATHVHHLDLNPLNNDPSNLIRVCDKCHKKIHSEIPNVNFIDTLEEATLTTYGMILNEKLNGVNPAAVARKYMKYTLKYTGDILNVDD